MLVLKALSWEGFSMSTSSDRRTPAQKRSKQRVEAILLAAKQLIAEKGYARLRIQDIAQRASVNPASIYQYFPEKNAVVLALGQQAVEQWKAGLVDVDLDNSSQEAAFNSIKQVVETFYEAHVADPALVDVWLSISTDKQIQDLDIQEIKDNGNVIFKCLAPYFSGDDAEGLEPFCLLLSHLTSATVRTAVQLGEEKGRVMIDQFKRTLRPDLVNHALGR